MLKKTSFLFIIIFIMYTLMPSTFAMPPTYVSSITITGDSQRVMFVGEKITLEAFATPEGVDSAYISWKADKSNIVKLETSDATVALSPPNSSAEITALETGTVTLTVYAATYPDAGEYNYDSSASITIVVNDYVPPMYVSDVKLLGSAERQLVIGQTISLQALATPEGADYVYLNWLVNTEGVINISQFDSTQKLSPPNGNIEITAISTGTTTITVYSAMYPEVDELNYDKSATITIIVSDNKTNVVETPTALPEERTFTSSIDVTLSCATEGATIFYSLSSPDIGYPAKDIEYTKPITLDVTTTITAYAVKDGMTESERLHVTFTKGNFVETPAALPNGGMFSSSINVTLSCATEGATIFYSLSSPDTDYPTEDIEYTKPITLDVTTTITAHAVKDEMLDSKQLCVTFTKGNAVETPAVSPSGGNFSSSIAITLSCATEGANIYYTTDGTPPTTNSTLYTENSLVLTNTTTVKAIAVKNGMANSGILEVKFTKQSGYSGGGGGGSVQVSAPSASLKSGEVVKNSLLMLTTSYSDSKIYYTVDGSTPTKNSYQYTEPIVIDKAMTIKYITMRSNKSSPVTTRTFTIREAAITLKQDASKIKYISGYSDGTFKPDMAISRYEVLTCLDNLFDIEKIEPTKDFADVQSEYKNLVNLFVGAGIIDGYADNTFKGENGLTRAELVKIISLMLRLHDSDNSTDITYSDISGHWAEKIINEFTKYGYLKGYNDGTFKPDKTISRAEFISFMNRIIGVKVVSEQQCPFSDLDKTHWAYNDISATYIKTN